jgi:aspartate beta-hydroxylase
MTLLYDQTCDALRGIFDSRIVGAPLLDLDACFPEGRRFVAAWRTIREEACSIAARLQDVPRFHEIMREQASISANDRRDWRMFILKAYGAERRANMAQCPALAGIVREIPDVLSASISFLAPGKHIPAHRGPFRGVLRFYLGLSMPQAADGRPAAVLRVAGRDHRVDEGGYLLWDDTFEHEVWNDSDQVRSVLLLDVWRRGMPIDMQILSRLVIAVIRLGIRIRGL